MGQITFGGLASGLDTEAIITALMDVERQPINRLEEDKTYFKEELNAYSEFDGKLSALNDAIKEMDSLSELSSYTASSSNEGLLSASADSSALPGVYSIEVVSLAEVQKDVSPEGFSDTDSKTLNGSLTIGETTIEYIDVSLNELASLINDSDSGVSASIINDGTEEGYRMILSGDQAGVTTEILGSGSINIDTATDGHTRNAVQAHIVVDNIDIYSNDNTINSAIPGVTLDLLDLSSSGETLTLKVATDNEAIEQKVNQFVSSYNDIINYLGEQKDADWGNDSSFRSTKRKLQSLLTTQIDTGGSLTSLSQLGLKTDYKTGTISIDSTSLNNIIDNDLEGLTTLFTGPNGDDGVANMFGDYLDVRTDSVDGLYAVHQDSYDSNIKRIDNRINSMELRLIKKEDNLRAEYTALELLMSEMNAQTTYLNSINTPS
ncbi:MAG: flagellar filament capping protein FliD [Desulfuromusa sp.]|nr:flagellar filament capping protein FliD [Desulfuromusa sp.]